MNDIDWLGVFLASFTVLWLYLSIASFVQTCLSTTREASADVRRFALLWPIASLYWVPVWACRACRWMLWKLDSAGEKVANAGDNLILDIRQIFQGKLPK